MNAAVNTANLISNRSIGEVWFPLLLLVIGGFSAASFWKYKTDKNAGKFKTFMWFIGMVVGLFGGILMYKKNITASNLVGFAKNKTTAGFQAGAAKFAEFRAARAAGAAPPGVTGNFRPPIQGAPPPALATA
jgi:hypothetical protein